MPTKIVPRGEPFDLAANTGRINEVFRAYREGDISREEAKRRLMEECRIEEYNVDPMLKACISEDPDEGDPL